MRCLFALLTFVASPALAQVSYPPGGAVDTSNLATKADVQAAQTTANNAVTTSALSAVQATIPPACATAPSGDTLNGSVGSGAACTPKQDSTRPTAVQAGNTTLLANCSFAITFARAFTSSTPFVYAAVVDTGSNQMPCKIQTRSSTGATGVCNGAQSTVLSLSIVTSGLTVLPFGTSCTAGTPVMFVGREPSQ